MLRYRLGLFFVLICVFFGGVVVPSANAAWSGTVVLTPKESDIYTNTSATLIATASSPINGSGFYIYIRNITTGVNVTSCSIGITCSYSARRYRNGTDKYVAYVASYQSNSSYIPPNIQAESLVADVSLVPWEVDLVAAGNPVLTDQLATLTASTNQPANAARIIIRNVTTGLTVKVCGGSLNPTDTTCSYTASRTRNGFDRYVAYVGDQNPFYHYYPTDIQAESNPLDISLVPWEVDLVASGNPVMTDQPATLTASTNQPANAARIIIRNVTTGLTVKVCGGSSSPTDTTCSYTASRTRNGYDRYVAYVGDQNPSYHYYPTDIQAESDPVDIHLTPWTVNLTATGNPVMTDKPATLTATTNQPANAARIIIRNITTGLTVKVCGGSSSPTDTTCSYTASRTRNGYDRYVAYVGDQNPSYHYYPTDIQAESNPLDISLVPWEVNLFTERTVDNKVQLDAFVNQPLAGSLYIYIINVSKKTIVGYCSTGKSCSKIYTPPSGGSYEYAAFVATYSTSLPLNNVQIGSPIAGPYDGIGPVGTYETAGGSNPSEICTQRCMADPVNTATGEFFLNSSDATVSGRGVSLSFNRTYTVSRANNKGALGYGWSHSYEMRVRPYVDGESLDTSERVVVIQENGSQVVFDRDSAGNYTAPSRVFATLSRDSNGEFEFIRKKQLSYKFDADGKLASITDRNGYTTSLNYNSADLLESVTDVAGRSLEFTYDNEGRISKVEDPAERTYKYAYDSVGDLVSVTQPDETTLSFTYDALHRMLSLADETDAKTFNEYDMYGRVVKQTDPLNRETLFTYGTDGVTTVTHPGGDIDEHKYESGLLMRETKGAGSSKALTTTYTYDEATLGVESKTDGRGKVWTYTYDFWGNRTSAKDPLGNESFWSWDSFNQLVEVTDPLGASSTISYDSSGNTTSVTKPLKSGVSATTTFVYENATYPGDVTKIIDPLGKATSLTWSGSGYLSSTTDAVGNKTSFTYSPLGWVKSTVSPAGNISGADPNDFRTAYTYDAMGRILSVTDPLDRSASTEYDAAGKVTLSTSPSGDDTTFAYNAAGQITQVSYADSSSKSLTYNTRGLIASESDGLGKLTTYTYDAVGRYITVTDPLSRTTTYSYNAGGLTQSITDSLARVTELEYDDAGQVTGINYSGPQTADVSITYDAAGRRTGMSDGSGSSTTAYDLAGRVVSTVSGAGKAVGYTYDKGDRLTSIAYPGTSRDVAYTYDDAGRMVSLTDWLANTTQFAYDDDANLSGINFPNGVNGEFTFNGAHEITSFDYQEGSTSLLSGEYQYTSGGLISSLETTGVPSSGLQSYLYSQLDQLKKVTGSVGAGSFTYDAAGSITTLANGATLTYNDAREPITLTPNSGPITEYEYSDLGERTKATTALDEDNYTYDQTGRLVLYSPSTGANTSYTYDGDGLRQSKKTGSAEKQYMTWTATGLPLLIDDTNNAYLYGPSGLAIAQVSTSDDVTYLHTDHLGSVRAITNSTADVIGTASYSAYGEANTTGVVSSLAYAGQYTDSESGLQYLRARYYDPQTGQFITRDPIEDMTGDPYGYADGNPVMNTDPLGLFSMPGWLDNGLTSFANSELAAGIVNIGRGASFGLSDNIVDHFNPGASCTVKQNEWQKGIGSAASLVVGAGGVRAVRAAKEPTFGRFRPAPFGNSSGHPIGRFPHYHRSKPNPARPGESLPGQGIGRHRPWETKSTDTGFWDRF